MAYNRNDTGRGGESWRDQDHGRHGGRSEERGFFERAGDEIASWFGDDDDHRDGRHFRGDDRTDRGEWHGNGRRPDERPAGYMGDRGYSRSRFDPQRDRASSGRDGGYRPMTGDYGHSEQDRGGGLQAPWGRDDYRRTSFTGSGRHSDPHYSAWRDRHLSELDRDYDEYHRERQQHFENDFGSWREGRQQKRQMLGQAREQMDVVGSDGEPVGKVDCIKGDRVILTKSDSPDGQHHSISCSMVERIESNQLTLNCSAKDAMNKWRDESHERALFERESQGEDGPHMLDRSFSSTYR